MTNLSKYQNFKVKAVNGTEMAILVSDQMLLECAKKIPFYGQFVVARQAYKDIYEKRNLENIINYLLVEVNNLKEKNIIGNNLNESELYFLFKELIATANNQPDDEMIRLLSKFVANSISEEFSEDKLKIVIFNKISQYTRQHIDILKHIKENDEAKLKEKNIGIDKNQFEYQKSQMKDIDTEIIEYCIIELERDGFIKREIGTYGSTVYTPFNTTGIGLRCLKMIDSL